MISLKRVGVTTAVSEVVRYKLELVRLQDVVCGCKMLCAVCKMLCAVCTKQCLDFDKNLSNMYLRNWEQLVLGDYGVINHS